VPLHIQAIRLHNFQLADDKASKKYPKQNKSLAKTTCYLLINILAHLPRRNKL